MVKVILDRAFATLKKKPIKLWAISCLGTLFTGLAAFMFGAIPGVYFCIQLLLEVGMTMVFLHGYREEEIHVVHIFDAFKGGWETVKRVLLGMAWMELWVFLWALIPGAGIYFGIVRAYEYRLVPYILINEPDVAPLDAIEVSKQRTKGYVGKMFLTDLLIGGVVAVAILTLALLAFLLGLIPYVGFVFSILFAIAEIVVCIVAVAFLPLLLGVVKAAYYEEISNPTMDPNAKPEKPAKAEPAPAPVAPAATKVCPACGAQVAEGAMFCANCGAKMEAPTPTPVQEAPTKFCANCGTKIAADAGFCPNCGTKLN